MRLVPVLLSAVLLAPSLALAQTDTDAKKPAPRAPSAPQADGARSPTFRSEIGGEVVIGERAPDFELDGSDGRTTRLSRLRGDWVLLVFGSRKEELAGLGKIVSESREIGMQVVGVTHEKTYFLRAWSGKEKIPFLVLADETCEVSATFGLYDSDRRTITSGFVLLDRDGIVRLALLGRRLPDQEIFELSRFTITGS